MADEIKLPLFHGNGSKDPEQHLFLYDVVWGAKQVQEDDVKKAQLMTTFRDYALTGFMKYYDPSLATVAPKSFAKIRTALKSEFKKPKS